MPQGVRAGLPQHALDVRATDVRHHRRRAADIMDAAGGDLRFGRLPALRGANVAESSTSLKRVSLADRGLRFSERVYEVLPITRRETTPPV